MFFIIDCPLLMSDCNGLTLSIRLVKMWSSAQGCAYERSEYIVTWYFVPPLRGQKCGLGKNRCFWVLKRWYLLPPLGQKGAESTTFGRPETAICQIKGVKSTTFFWAKNAGVKMGGCSGRPGSSLFGWFSYPFQGVYAGAHRCDYFQKVARFFLTASPPGR